MSQFLLVVLGTLALSVAALQPIAFPSEIPFLNHTARELASDLRSVPEPSTYIMILSGAGMLFLSGRFRRKR
jgi:hypothetical protein